MMRPADAQTTSINFALDWIVSGRHAPWFLTLEKGYYRDGGLDVKISRGYGFQDGVTRLLSGQSQFNFNDISSLVIARASHGTAIKAVALIYPKIPVAVFSLKKSNILKPLISGETIQPSQAAQPRAVPRFCEVQRHIRNWRHGFLRAGRKRCHC